MINQKKYILLILISILVSGTASGQKWSLPVTIFEDPVQGASFLSVAMEQNGRIHLVWGGNIHNDSIPDSLYYIQKMDSYVSKLVSLNCDTTIFSISSALDENQNLHVVWGEGNGNWSTGVLNIYHSSIVSNTWTSPRLIKNFDIFSSRPSKCNLIALPDSSLLVYWNIFSPSGTWFIYFENNHWGEPFKPFPEYSEDLKNHTYGIADYPNHFLSKDGMLHFTFRGIADGEEPPPGKNFICPIVTVEISAWDRKWEDSEIKKVNVSVTEGYFEPKIVTTDETIKYIFWLVDKDLNNQSDEIYYSFSEDGDIWSDPISMTENMGDFIVEQYLAPDRDGNIHVVWRRWLIGTSGGLETRHYYAVVNKESYSEYEVISDMYYWKGARSINLIVDENNRVHLFWLEYMNLSDYTGTVIKHSWRDLGTGLTEKELTDEGTDFATHLDVTVYPNPFNESMNITIKLVEPGLLTASIYNINGQLISSLISNKQVVSETRLTWSGTNDHGVRAASGVYYYVVQFKNSNDGKEEKHIGKFVLLK